MSQWKPLGWSEAQAREKAGDPIEVRPKRFDSEDDPKNVYLVAGSRIKFATPNIAATGQVLSLDWSAVYPLKVEWFTPQGDKRVTSLSPDEFIKLVRL